MLFYDIDVKWELDGGRKNPQISCPANKSAYNTIIALKRVLHLKLYHAFSSVILFPMLHFHLYHNRIQKILLKIKKSMVNCMIGVCVYACQN